MKLAGDEHRCDANELKLRDNELPGVRHEAVDEAHCALQRLGEQAELHLAQYEPVDKDLTLLACHSNAAFFEETLWLLIIDHGFNLVAQKRSLFLIGRRRSQIDYHVRLRLEFKLR